MGSNTTHPRNKNQLQTVDRALAILLAFDHIQPEWGVTDLARKLDLPTSNVQRILATLAGRGFLRVNETSRKYRLGPAMWHIASLWERTAGLDQLARKELKSLASLTGRSALLSIPDGTHARVVSVYEGQLGPQNSAQFQHSLYPAHAGAAPRAYFCFLDAHTCRSLLRERPLGRFSDTTPTNWSTFKRIMKETRALGYALSEGEFNEHTRGLGVPVLVSGQPLASLTILEDRRKTNDPILSWLPELEQAARIVGVTLTENIASKNVRATTAIQPPGRRSQDLD